MTSANSLDLVITTASRTTPLVSNVVVNTFHRLSDYSIVVFESSVRCQKFTQAVSRYSYRNIENVNVAEFESRKWGADIFITNPPDTPDAYADLLESTEVDILDELAPVQQATVSSQSGHISPRRLCASG